MLIGVLALILPRFKGRKDLLKATFVKEIFSTSILIVVFQVLPIPPRISWDCIAKVKADSLRAVA